MLKLFKEIREWLNPRVVRDTTNDKLVEPLPKSVKPSVEFYKDRRGEWRWKVKAVNGEIIGASSEGYSSRTACEKNLRTLTRIKF